MATDIPMLSAQSIALAMEGRDAATSGRGARLRAAAHMSQAELAEHIGVSAAAVSRWESGRRRPGGAHAIAYAQALRVIASRLAGA